MIGAGPAGLGVTHDLDGRAWGAGPEMLEEATGGSVVICRLDAPDTELAQRIHQSDAISDR